MPFLAPLGAAGISALIGGGASVLGSTLSGKSQTSTSTPTLSPELQQLQSQLLSYSQSLLDPNSNNATRSAGIDQINRNYSTMPGKVQQQLSSRGFGRSGKVGTAMYNVENARLGNLSNFESQLEQQGSSLGMQLLNSGRGTTTTGPSNMAANGLMSAGNGLSNLSTLLMLQNVLGGGGGGGFTLPNSSIATTP
jgi:hypothetical protein